MSVSSREGLPGTTVPAGQPHAAHAADRAGRFLGRITVLPTLLAMSFLLGSFLLLLIGEFKPILVIGLWVLIAVAVVPLGWRLVPSVVGDAGGQPVNDLGLPARLRATPLWVPVSIVVIAIAFGIFQGVEHSQWIIVLRDPASYFQFGYWISHHGSVPIPQDKWAFGGKGSYVTFDSYAYYDARGAVVPQFMAGLPMTLSLGFWAAGINGALLTAPLLGALAVLVFAGLAARLLGPRWAPLAALLLAVSFPEAYTSRMTYSEPLAQILFLGGLSLVIDALRLGPGRIGTLPDTNLTAAAERTGGWTGAVRRFYGNPPVALAALGGLALGITLLVRLDGPSDTLPFIPFAGLLLLSRRVQAKPLLIGFAIGTLYGAVDGLILTRPYLHTNISSVIPLALIVTVAVVVTAVYVRWRWDRGVHRVPGWLSELLVVAPLVVLFGFLIRPYIEKNWAKHQYAPISLHWIFWYLGIPAVGLATLGVVILVRATLRGRASAWVLPLAVFAWTIFVGLLDPAITPDQPWASRRLVPAVLPGFILFALWFIAWVCGQLRDLPVEQIEESIARVAALRFGRIRAFVLEMALPPVSGLRDVLKGAGSRRARWVSGGVAAICALGLVVPTTQTMFDLRIQNGTLKAGGVAFTRTHVGEVAAVNHLCTFFGPGDAVLIVDGSLANRMSEVIRGMCGVPTARLHHIGGKAAVKKVALAVEDIEKAGQRPILLFAHRAQLKEFLDQPGTSWLYQNGTTSQVMSLTTRQDQQLYLGKPKETQSLIINIWMWEQAK